MRNPNSKSTTREYTYSANEKLPRVEIESLSSAGTPAMFVDDCAEPSEL
jgi:hypothetical protein